MRAQGKFSCLWTKGSLFQTEDLGKIPLPQMAPLQPHVRKAKLLHIPCALKKLKSLAKPCPAFPGRDILDLVHEQNRPAAGSDDFREGPGVK